MADALETKVVDHGINQRDLEKQATLSNSTANPNGLPPLQETISHVSHDMHPVTSYVEVGDDVYDRLSVHRKQLITAILSLCGFLAPISSTTVLAAVPEVAATYKVDGVIINLSNAIYMIFMGLSPLCWGPLAQTYGRRWICICAMALFVAFSVGSAMAPNLASFFIFRMLTAFQGTCLLIVGASVIGDIFRPTERATALGWFLSGTLIGPAFGPFIGAIIVTFKSWRGIFWLQSALGGLAFVLVVLFLPETIHQKRSAQLEGMTRREYVKTVWQWSNPVRVIRLYKYPNLIVVGIASSSLVWNMYSLLTPIRYVLNPRFHLDSPLQSGLFYIAPGCGYLVGTFFGGRWADHVVRKWIQKRGRRVPEDRLRSSLTAMLVVAACVVIYGWSVEKAVGGVPLPVLVMFIQGVAQLFCFPSLNTYCLDVMQRRSAEVVAGNYLLRYLFGAAGSALCLPAIQKIGVGWFSTISAMFLVVATGFVMLTTRYGERMRQWADGKKDAGQEQAHEGSDEAKV